VASVLAALYGFAASAQEPSRPALKHVPGLETLVSYSETKIPLGELVAKVVSDTGVKLSAAPAVADEPVAVVVKEFPARELLEQLADVLDYQWRVRRDGAIGRHKDGAREDSAREGGRPTPDSSKPGRSTTERPTPERPSAVYEIWQDLASKQREEALRSSLSAAVEQRFQEELERYRAAVKLSPAEIRRQWDDWLVRGDQLHKLSPEQFQAWLNSHEATDWDRRSSLLENLTSPIQRSLAGLATGLSPEQWAALRAGRQIVFSSAPRTGELPLPADVLHTFQSSQPGDHPPGWELTLPADPDMAEEIRRKEKEMQGRWVGADGYQVTVRLTPDYPSPGRIVFNAITSPVRGGQRVGPFYENPYFVLDVNPLDLQPPLGEDPARKALLAHDPLLGEKRQFPPRTEAHPASPPVPHSFRSLQDLLPDLARTYGANFIADSYWTAPGIDDRELTAQPIALYELLDRFTFLNHWIGRGYRWDRHGSLIWLRGRYWFLDRQSEIPLRYVRRWIEQCDRLGSLTLAEDAAMASALTDPQLRSISQLLQSGAFPPQLQDLAGLYSARHILRLYAALLPDQRQALEQGGNLSIAVLPARLRPLVRATLNEIARMQYPLMDLDQWATGRLSLTGEPQIRVREERGGRFSYRLEPLPTPGTAQPLTKPRTVASQPAVPRVSVQGYPVTKLKLQLFYGPQSPASIELVVGPPHRV
jgi:hypothetical protein